MLDAASTNHLGVMKLLLEIGLERHSTDYYLENSLGSALEIAVFNGGIAMAKLLVDVSDDIDVGRVLYIAVSSDNTEMAKLLAMNSSEMFKITALLLAAIENKIEMVKTLVEVCDQETIHHSLPRIGLSRL